MSKTTKPETVFLSFILYVILLYSFLLLFFFREMKQQSNLESYMVALFRLLSAELPPEHNNIS